MNYIVKTLTLYENLKMILPGEQLFSCECTIHEVSKNDEQAVSLENKSYIGFGENTIIPEGKYFFVQTDINSEAKNNSGVLQDSTWNELRNVAEEIYLETIWAEVKLKHNRPFIRKLEEGTRAVFQFFWEII